MDDNKNHKILPADTKSPADSLKELFYTYHKKLVYFSMQIVGDQSLADDLVQEVFIHISQWPASNFYREEDYIRNYLYKAVKNQSINALKGQQKLMDKSGDLQEPVQDTTVLHHLIQSELVGMVYEAMESLPEGCRTVAELAYLEGKNNKEVAEILGVTVNTVKTQKQRSLKLLRLRLNPEVFMTFVILING
ncbi:sigma-70 family RNA polymerase sigma factor [Echinicola marina]|uniref:RNA polymerase sigma factor n=1 Tax=Echinicola marina TaxID=2859768 RepID=UPI001CF676FE|nr:sigma-70 family RNA polymerase sigma factor [Echinicola marina]UCS92100.1 sigma-70 family RNA polymerase sigma factor [Echinicola marina]